MLGALFVTVMWMFKKERRESRLPDHYFELRLLPVHKEALLKLLEGKVGISFSQKQELHSRVLASIRFDLPPAEIKWSAWEEQAQKRGESLADLIGDAPWE